LRQPQAIGIIDGYFHRVPAVWHKEILWAMSEGIHVFGSASMGALRASELHRYGMIGVGRVFETYRDGRLEDDDEVVVMHSPESFGYHIASGQWSVSITLRAPRKRVIGRNAFGSRADRERTITAIAGIRDPPSCC
jgi:hypothetical protein